MPLMIKSPQLYRLSYRPSFRNLVSGSPCVSPVYPGPIAGRSYHEFPAVSS